MRSLIAVLPLCLMLAGCSSMATTKAAFDASVIGNWRINCVDDHAKAERMCFAGSFGPDARTTLKYFQIAFVNGVGPVLVVPNDYPGQVPTVRVDEGPVLSDPAAIVQALMVGKTAYVVFYHWPEGEQRMTVDVTGFPEAYAALLKAKTDPA